MKTAELKKEFSSVFESFRSGFADKEGYLPEEREKKERIEDAVKKSPSPFHKRFIDELDGYGPLEPLLQDPSVTEIIVNNQNSIAFERSGSLTVLPDSFLSSLTFQSIVERICMEAHLAVNLKKPFAEGKWKSFRAHIIMPPLTPRDFHLILRRHPQNTWTFERLSDESWGPPESFDLLRSFLKKKYNFLIVGPTNCGKTSLLNACLQALPANERIVAIEDADEIFIPNGASAKLLTQTAPESSSAIIDQEALVKQSLRLRPDRIVMGEVRGAEAKDLLLALSSGHRGSLGTLHGESHRQALWKMETLAQIGAPQWRSDTIRRLIFLSLQGVVVLERRGPQRLLKGIYKIAGLEETGFLFEALYERP